MNNKAGLSAVFFVVLVDLIGFGIILPLLPFYASRFNASALVIGLLYSVYSFSQLIFSPIWGGWSDRVGRRPIMLLSTCGSTLSYILFSFSYSLPVLFASRILAGIMGGNIAAAQAYVADVTAPEDRAKGMGLIGVAFGIGFALGPAIAGVLLIPGVQEKIIGSSPELLRQHLTENAYSLPALAASLMSAISFMLVVLFLPESVDLMKKEDTSRISKVWVFSKKFWTNLRSAKSRTVPTLYLCMLLITIGHSSLYSAFPLFCKNTLGLDANHVAMQFLIMGLIAIFIQGGLIRRVVKNDNELKFLICGSFLMSIGMLLIPFAKNVFMLSCFLSVMAIGGSLNGPTLTSLASKKSDSAQMGLAMGNLQAMASLGRVIGPSWGGWLYGLNPRASFFATAVLVFLTVAMALSIKKTENS